VGRFHFGGDGIAVLVTRRREDQSLLEKRAGRGIERTIAARPHHPAAARAAVGADGEANPDGPLEAAALVVAIDQAP
jgi:hypothetical protein